MVEIFKLHRIQGTNPQYYSIGLKVPAKSIQTKFGTEAEIRTLLQKNGVAQSDIDELFRRTEASVET